MCVKISRKCMPSQTKHARFISCRHTNAQSFQHRSTQHTNTWTELEAYLLLDVAQLRGGWEKEIRNWWGGRVDGRHMVVLELNESKRHETLGEQQEGPRYYSRAE